jgi:hypothetical protein
VALGVVGVPSVTGWRNWVQTGVTWLLCAVGIGLMPVLMQMIWALNRGHPLEPMNVLARGELFILATALLGGTVYELLHKPVPDGYETTKRILLAAVFFFAILSTLWFADLSAAFSVETPKPLGEFPRSTAPTNTPREGVAYWAVLLLSVSVLLGFRALLLPEERDAS